MRLGITVHSRFLVHTITGDLVTMEHCYLQGVPEKKTAQS